MKRFLCILFCLLALRAEATLTITNKGAFSNNVLQTTLTCTLANAVSAGTLGVLLCSFDNNGAGGSTKIFTSSMTDSKGNTWTLLLDTIYDPGGAGAGIETAAYTATINTALAVNDTIIVTLSTSAQGKCAYLLEVSGSSVPTVVDSGSISDLLTSGQTGTAISMTTNSIASGNGIIAWLGAETQAANSAVDTDTVNGSWSTQAGATLGTPIRITQQTKVTTGTGTQTWDVTLGASVDWHAAWIQVTDSTTTNTSNGFFILSQ